MGGSGAKNRRRQLRHGSAGSSTDSKKKGKPSVERRSPFPRHHASDKKPFQHAKPKKKFQKPKHLKRKLEALSENDPARQELLKQVEALNEIKAKGAGPRRQVVKKARVDTASNSRSRATSYSDRQSTPSPTKRNQDESSSAAQKAEPVVVEPPSVSSVVEVDRVVKPKEKNETPPKEAVDSDDESISVSEDAPRRRRGRRRQGRKDTSQQVTEEPQAEPESKIETAASAAPTSHAVVPDPKPDSKKKQRREDDKRYCIGRKPVTDFEIGKSYSGKVVYVKPFGIFLDIGCHSDAFCHVSRLSDDYVESAETLFQSGDTVPNARVVEIDRRLKRITVSLQSEARIADEQASADARAKRKSKNQKAPVNDQGSSLNARHHVFSAEKEKETIIKSSASKNPVGSYDAKKDAASPPPSTDNLTSKPESEMTRAELKRARKLQRRAERRQQQQQQESGNDS